MLTATATSFGTVLSVDRQAVSFRDGCEGNSRSSIPLDSVLLIQFDGQCMPHEMAIPSAGLSRCEQQRRHAFRVSFSGVADPYVASSIRISNGTVFLQSFDESAALSGPVSQIRSIQPVNFCPDEPPAEHYPESYCFETRKWAVNWSPLPIFSNQVFTRGSSIYVERIGSTLALSLDQVRDAYQTALSLWAIALQEHRNELGSDIVKYVENSTASGGKYRLFTPPQVVRTDCAANALAIVKWYSKRQDAFPTRDKNFIAKAQLQGRTILLNANDNVFRSEKQYTKALPAKDVNLVTVFVHELGHSFGLPDRYDIASVMNPDYVVDHSNLLVSPNAQDAVAFAAVLRASIAGTAPGVFNAKDCAGLRRRQ